ncbi:Ig-like domain-containing protein, partial [Sharpea azabuensis]
YVDYFADIYVSLLRNAKTLSFTYTDATTGEVYLNEVIENVPKSYYVSAYGMALPYIYSWYSPEYKLTDTEGNTLPNNTKLNLSIKATLDYDAHESNNVSDEWVTPITVDTEAPVVTAAKAYRDETTGKYYMELTVSDNVKVAAVNFLNKSATNVLAQYPVDTVEQGAECTMTYDITGFGEELVVILGDYACNERAYVLEAEGNEPEVDESLLYGYRVYDANYSDDTLYGWIGIDAASADVKVCSSEYYVDYALTAATYVGGMIVAVDANNDLVAIKPGYWDERSKIASLGTTINQLVFDATTETLYGYNKANNALVTIDIATGELTRVTDENSYFSGIVTMACDDEGNLYGVNSSGVLKTINKTTGTWGDELLNTYSVTNSYPSYAQSMTYDAETDSLYWARFSSSYYTGYTGVLYKIDLANNYAMTAVGTIAGNAEVVGLLKLDSGDYELPENAKVESISLDQSSVSVLVGGSETVNVVKTPWYAESEDYVWSSTDEKIAVVSDGKIVGKDVGTTTIKVTTEDGKLTASCEVTVVNPQSDLTAFVMSGDTLYNQWISFSADATSDYETLSEDDFLSFYAGEYVDGYIYAYSSATELYKIDASTLDAETISKTKISTARSDCYVADMAYDYRTGYMYALVQDLANDYSLRLAYVDVLTGDIETISDSLVNEYENTMISLAVATDGTIYMLSVDGLLYTYDVTARTLTKIGYTGYSASSMSQCLAYDHDTDELYWTMLSYSGASLMYIDTTTGKALPLGSIDGMAQVVCMYTEPDAAKLPERAEVAVESVTAKTTSISLIEGATVAIPVSVKPYNATDRNITWTSADETVAVVANGMLTGKGEGTTTITGKLANFTVTINVEVIESAGAVTGYILSDLSDGSGMFWGDFKDSDLSNGNGLADASEYYLYAGEYYDGKVYGYGPNADTYDYSFIVYDRDDLTVEKSVVCKSAPDVVEMAFDYSTGVMYAVAGIKNTETNTTLYMVDTETGDLYKVADLSQRIMTLACTEAGVMYGISVDGALYQINKTTGELTMIGDTGYGANMYQSMAYDYNTGNMYWAQTYYDPGTWLTTAYLFVVDVTDASVVNLGQVGTAGCQISALHIMPQKEMTVSAPTVTGVLLNKASELLQVGETTTLSAKTAPLSVAQASGTITYTSDNTSVATVDANGVITAVAAGTANITAAYGTVSATCVINVVGTETQLYAVNTSGWEKSPLLQPGTIASTVSLPEDAGLTIARACYCQVGFFYAIDTDGYLWKYTEDLTVCEKIGTQTVVAQLSNTDDFETDTAIVDMAANGTDVYVMASGVSGWMNIYYIYKLDLTTGAATIVKEVSETVPRPVAFTFISASEVVIYDGYTDYIYKSDITESSADEEQLAFVQFTVASGDHITMTYSSSLKQVFIATDVFFFFFGSFLISGFFFVF